MSVQQQRSARRVRGTSEAKADSAAAIDQPDAADRLSKIAVAAYFIAERRGFLPGHELDDWLSAEAEVDGSGLPSVVTSIDISAKGKAS
jgi:hypothetical protein